MKTRHKVSHIMWLMLVDCTIAAGSTLQVRCDAVVVILNAQVGELILRYPAKNKQKIK